jgi:hypothetical protein
MSEPIVIKNEDVREVFLEVPEGHKHLRTTIVLSDGRTIVLQEATVANIVRAFVTIKTHPQIEHLVLKGRELKNVKKGFARWQLLEVER